MTRGTRSAKMISLLSAVSFAALAVASPLAKRATTVDVPWLPITTDTSGSFDIFTKTAQGTFLYGCHAAPDLRGFYDSYVPGSTRVNYQVLNVADDSPFYLPIYFTISHNLPDNDIHPGTWSLADFVPAGTQRIATIDVGDMIDNKLPDYDVTAFAFSEQPGDGCSVFLSQVKAQVIFE
ncbi:hypothetical protein BT69DRAFT_1315860 [Atractiella rhizophila]|nr:hypothetical protein BT69DRAFT_1315860 [Atractiella rhizophila]